jgi:ubiquitin carboxyl-terminal hydrolase 22/27/51
MYDYDLFAVINHEGQIDNGHYTNFARFQDEVSLAFAHFTILAYETQKWYRFDDEK